MHFIEYRSTVNEHHRSHPGRSYIYILNSEPLVWFVRKKMVRSCSNVKSYYYLMFLFSLVRPWYWFLFTRRVQFPDNGPRSLQDLQDNKTFHVVIDLMIRNNIMDGDRHGVLARWGYIPTVDYSTQTKKKKNRPQRWWYFFDIKTCKSYYCFKIR